MQKKKFKIKLVLVSGKAQSGKDTFYEQLSKLTKCNRFAFADDLKNIARKRFKWDGSKTGKGRQLLIDIGCILRGDLHYPWYKLIPNWRGIWVEHILKKFYTPHMDFWCEKVEKSITNYIYYKNNKDSICVITDCRFKNEVEFFKKNSHYDILTVRINKNNRSLNIDDVSEKDLDDYKFDLYLDNNKGYIDFQKLIKRKVLPLLKDNK